MDICPFCLAQTHHVVPDAATTSRSRHAGVAVVVALAIGYSWLAGHFTTFTRQAEIATFLPGLVAIVVALRISPRTPPPARRRRWLAWWLVVIAFTVVELASLALGANHAHPTVSDLINPWLRSTPSRAAAFALWLSFGLWLTRR